MRLPASIAAMVLLIASTQTIGCTAASEPYTAEGDPATTCIVMVLVCRGPPALRRLKDAARPTATIFLSGIPGASLYAQYGRSVQKFVTNTEPSVQRASPIVVTLIHAARSCSILERPCARQNSRLSIGRPPASAWRKDPAPDVPRVGRGAARTPMTVTEAWR